MNPLSSLRPPELVRKRSSDEMGGDTEQPAGLIRKRSRAEMNCDTEQQTQRHLKGGQANMLEVDQRPVEELDLEMKRYLDLVRWEFELWKAARNSAA